MIRLPDCIRVAPRAWIGELPILAPIDSSAAFILQRRSFGLMFAKGSVDSGTLITTFEDLNSLITRLGGGIFGADSDRVGGRLDFTALAHDLVGFAGSG